MKITELAGKRLEDVCVSDGYRLFVPRQLSLLFQQRSGFSIQPEETREKEEVLEEKVVV